MVDFGIDIQIEMHPVALQATLQTAARLSPTVLHIPDRPSIVHSWQLGEALHNGEEASGKTRKNHLGLSCWCPAEWSGVYFKANFSHKYI